MSRSAFPTVPVTVEYTITPLGATLAAVLHPLSVWAEANIEAVLEAQSRYDALMCAAGMSAAYSGGPAPLASAGAPNEDDNN